MGLWGLFDMYKNRVKNSAKIIIAVIGKFCEIY